MGGMKEALASGNIESAVNFFDDETKDITRIYLLHCGRLPQLVQGMQDIQIITGGCKDAKYRIRRNELYNGQSLTVTYYIYWGIDRNGLWKNNLVRREVIMKDKITYFYFYVISLSSCYAARMDGPYEGKW